MKLEFHHINFVSEDVDRLHEFYTQVLGLDDIPIQSFPRPVATSSSGYDGKIRFATDGKMQMHLATKDLTVAFKNGEVFYSLREAQVLIEEWRNDYNTKRPHGALGHRPPAPETIVSMDAKPIMH